MAAKIFRINYKSDFILTLNSDAGWMTPFCIKFWTGAPSQAYFVGWDGETYTHCAYDQTEPTKLLVQFDDHHLPIGDLKFQIAYHFTVADFPNDTEDEVINPSNITTEIDGQEFQVMLDFTGETAPEIQFSLPAYANEAQRIANEQERVREFAQMQEENAQAVEGAENVNATLNGNILTVTNREGQSTSVNTKGEAGHGVPAGGLTGQILSKKSDDDYDTGWQDPHAAGVNSVNGKTGNVTLNASDVGALSSDTPIPTVPTNVSEFTNDAGYITKTVNDLVNYYLKSDTYTKTEVQQLISAIQQFTYQVVSSLPTATADTMNIIYLVPSADPQTQNVKDEYITIDNGVSATTRYTWEQIGSTAIDLSGYYTSQQTDTAITTALNTALADYTTTSALTLLLAAKQDVISDLATIRSGAAAGATAYQKPQGGIPSTDMSQAVQTSLSKADSALQQHQDISGKEDVTTIVAPVNATDATLPVTSLTTEVGKYYRIDVAVETLAVTLPAMTETSVGKAVVLFLTGGTAPAVTITSTAPAGGTAPAVHFADGFEIKAGETNEVNCYWNGLAWIVASVKIVISNS